MNRLIVLLMVVVGVVLADKYGHDDHHGGHGYHDDHHGGHGYGHDDHYDHHDNIDYKFHYDVKDDKTYNYQSRTEKKDGKNIYGTYTLVEPDGKKRIVKYKADDYGFHAEVNHEGGYKNDYKKDDYHYDSHGKY